MLTRSTHSLNQALLGSWVFGISAPAKVETAVYPVFEGCCSQCLKAQGCRRHASPMREQSRTKQKGNQRSSDCFSIPAEFSFWDGRPAHHFACCAHRRKRSRGQGYATCKIKPQSPRKPTATKSSCPTVLPKTPFLSNCRDQVRERHPKDMPTTNSFAIPLVECACESSMKPGRSLALSCRQCSNSHNMIQMLTIQRWQR